MKHHQQIKKQVQYIILAQIQQLRIQHPGVLIKIQLLLITQVQRNLRIDKQLCQPIITLTLFIIPVRIQQQHTPLVGVQVKILLPLGTQQQYIAQPRHMLHKRYITQRRRLIQQHHIQQLGPHLGQQLLIQLYQLVEVLLKVQQQYITQVILRTITVITIQQQPGTHLQQRKQNHLAALEDVYK